jgi:CHAT domain-containing protein/tetratricopeptide (TPR) repeat protein
MTTATRLSLVAALLVAPLWAADPPEKLSVEEKAKLTAEAERLDKEGMRLYQQGKPAEAAETFEKALVVVRRLYPAEQYPDGHDDVANVLANLGAFYQVAGNYPKALANLEQCLAMKRKLYPASKYPDGHPSLATVLNNLGSVLASTAGPAKAKPYCEEALAMLRKLYPESKYPDGHPDLAQGLAHLLNLNMAMGDLPAARKFGEEALAMAQRLYPEAKHPQGSVEVATALNNLAVILQRMGEIEEARKRMEQTLAQFQKLYPAERFPDGHPNLATIHNNLGLLLSEVGALEQSRDHYEKALAMRQRLFPAARYPDGHPALAQSLHNLGALLSELGNYEQGTSLQEQALAMRRRLFPAERLPNGHHDLAVSLNGMGVALLIQNQPDRALAFMEEALAMRRRLYPPEKFPAGHPDIAICLDNLAQIEHLRDHRAKARTLAEESLAMRRQLYPPSKYPDGHPEPAQALNSLGYFCLLNGEYDRARDCFDQALAMNRRLYPKEKFPEGHPNVAANLLNLSRCWQSLGDYDRALPLCEESLDLWRRRFPESRFPAGTPQLVRAWNNLGMLELARGEPRRARPPLEQALAMTRKLFERELFLAGEADALALVLERPLTLDAYLTATRDDADASARAYQEVWESKAALMRIQALRHAAARAGNPEAAAKLSRLHDVRRQIERLLQDAARPAEQRDRLLADWTEQSNRLQRELAASLPERARLAERFRLAPAALSESLPADTAFIDLVFYVAMSPDATARLAGGLKYEPSYAAFVVTAKQPPRRVDLGAARPLNEAVATWRQAIDKRQDSPAAAELARRVWQPIARQLPKGIRTVYLSPDGDLARLPWAALPGDQPGQVLLEQYALTTVPHGPFLVEALKYPGASPSARRAAVAVGGVSYGSSSWPALPGSGQELKAVQARAEGGPFVALSGEDATPQRLRDELPKAQFAHFATHGFFAEPELTADRLRERIGRARSSVEGLNQRSTGWKNPLGYTGLVLAKGEVMTGLTLVDLPLEGLRLATLSACDTGLGAYTGGEGVQGLERAFHVAGCPNVIASLWKINDAATAALMAKFYHELWANNKPPVEALRQAQLTIYRRPDLIPDLAGERGRPALEAAAKLGPAVPAKPEEKAKVAPAKLWAGFTLSGLGQ